MSHDYIARRSIPNSHKENQSSYSIFRQLIHEKLLLIASRISLLSHQPQPTYTHYSDRADLLGSSLSLLIPFLFEVLQLSLWSHLFWLL